MLKQMEPISKLVASYLDRDGVIQEGIRRNIVNNRALARWIIEKSGADLSEEAVLSAIRRYSAKSGGSVHDQANRLLPHASLSLRSKVTLLVLEKTPVTRKRLSSVFNKIDYSQGEALWVIQSEKAIKLLIDAKNQHEIMKTLGENLVLETVENLTEIDVSVPRESITTPGVLASVLNELAFRQINVVEVVSGLPEILIFVHEDDGLEAYRALSHIIETAKERSARR